MVFVVLLFTFEISSKSDMQNKKITLASLTGWKNYGKYRFLLHTAVWLLYVVAYAYIYALFYESVTFSKSIFQFSVTAWIDVSAAYLLVYFLIPRYLLSKKYSTFLIWFLLSAIGFILMQRLILQHVTYRFIYPEYADRFTFFKFNYLYTFFNIYVMAAIFASVKLFEYWYVNQMQNQELQKQKLESELKFLKSQIHPHFLFNTLNNLYALTLDKSEEAPEVVVKLSDLLSYMLYECNAPKVPLEKELNLLKDYLALEKIRYRNELKIDFDIQGRVNGKLIAPLLLIPFVENGFKHGLSKQIKNPWINISVEVEDYLLNFKVENNKPKTETEDKTGYTEGIGLKNVRRRLDLIYGDDYELKVENERVVFGVCLTINLDSRLESTEE
jgi:sensor histidine kinase YesM